LSPKANREIPPLDYGLVFKMKEKFPSLHISLNGGVTNLKIANDLLERGVDGVMIGRSAYQKPAEVLSDVDRNIFVGTNKKTPFDVANIMRDYLSDYCDNGGNPHHVTRHMLGLFHGLPGAKIWKQYLSNLSSSQGLDFYDDTLMAIDDLTHRSAA
jgi:tRNA-dihydrouridine synthase A